MIKLPNLTMNFQLFRRGYQNTGNNRGSFQIQFRKTLSSLSLVKSHGSTTLSIHFQDTEKEIILHVCITPIRFLISIKNQIYTLPILRTLQSTPTNNSTHTSKRFSLITK